MKRKIRLVRRKRLRPYNPERRAQLRAKQFGAQAALCRTLPCCACGAPPPSDPHHVRSRGAGGVDSDTVPLCRECHRRTHAGNYVVWNIDGARYVVDPRNLAAVAADLAKRVRGQ